MSLTFLQLQNKLIISPAARFKEAQRTDIKDWINDRYAEVWGAEQWTFRRKTANPVITSGAGSVTGLPADLGPVLLFQRDDGEPLNYLSPQQFNENYYGSTSVGTPAEYTVVNGAVTVGPTPSLASTTYQMLYEAKLTPLVNDTDVPAIPGEYHFMLVHGAIATGSVMMNDFTYQFAEQRWQNQLEAMRRSYRVDQRGDYSQWGADPIGADGW